MTMTGNSPEPIDLQEALNILDDDRELLHDCFVDYFENAPEMIEDIAKAVSAGKAENLSNAAHRFKGTLRYLAATNAADMACQLEMLGEKGELTNAENILAALIKECERIKEFMAKYIKQEGG